MAKCRVVECGRNILIVGGSLNLFNAQELVGQAVERFTGQANERAAYTIESVSQNRETGDILAWLTRPDRIGGGHARIVANREAGL